MSDLWPKGVRVVFSLLRMCLRVDCVQNNKNAQPQSDNSMLDNSRNRSPLKIFDDPAKNNSTLRSGSSNKIVTQINSKTGNLNVIRPTRVDASNQLNTTQDKGLAFDDFDNSFNEMNMNNSNRTNKLINNGQQNQQAMTSLKGNTSQNYISNPLTDQSNLHKIQNNSALQNMLSMKPIIANLPKQEITQQTSANEGQNSHKNF